MHPQLIALIQQNRMQEARGFCARLCEAQPDNAQAHFMMSAICGQLGDFAGSETSVLRAIEIEPSVPEAHYNLGIARLRQGKTDAAIESFRQALALRPVFPEALCNLGSALLELDRQDEAIASLGAALAANPQLSAAHLALGELYLARDKGKALDHCHAALRNPPPDAEFLSRLASLCKQLGLLEACIDCNRKALQFRPRDARLLSNLGVALKEAGRLEDAIGIHQQAVVADPGLAEAHYNLATALAAANRQQEAEAAYHRAIESRPVFAEALTNLGTLQLLQGRADEALERLEEAVRQAPEDPLAASNRLLALNYTLSVSRDAVFAAHRDWGQAFAARVTPLEPLPGPGADTGPLRIGFVSPDLRNHSVAFFFTTLLDHADRGIEIHCYSNTRRVDPTTERIRAQVAGWRDISDVADAEAAALVRQDGIDVLVDLAGHTGDHRLGLFALRPSPVQVTYLGYPNTTGLPAIDYRITDAIADPEGYDAFHTERLLRLDRCFLCYAPPADAPEPRVPGAARDGAFTFSSFNNLAKISPEMIRVWSEILVRVPGSRLMIKNRPLGDPGVAARFRAQFAAHGIGPERLELLSWIPDIDTHLATYNQVDIALDTFPYHGTTTTCEALWMGRPVVVLSGATHASRVGTSLLHSMGLDDFIADTDQAYIEIAVALANSIRGSNPPYGDLRERMRQSPVCDRHDFQHRFFAMIREVVQP